MKIKMNVRLPLFLFLCLLVMSSGAFGGNKKLMTVKKAKALASRALVESVIGLKIRSNALWASKPDDYNRVESKVMAEIKGF